MSQCFLFLALILPVPQQTLKLAFSYHFKQLFPPPPPKKKFGLCHLTYRFKSASSFSCTQQISLAGLVTPAELLTSAMTFGVTRSSDS